MADRAAFPRKGLSSDEEYLEAVLSGHVCFACTNGAADEGFQIPGEAAAMNLKDGSNKGSGKSYPSEMLTNLPQGI
ncbi:hypothetical protein E4U55_000620 [Claviceps digitariae]|nr:hypothetical protein E4U55_000620 [Claviceps digitariae]